MHPISPNETDDPIGGGLPFERPFRVRGLGAPQPEPPRPGELGQSCEACSASDEEYLWVADRWRVRATKAPSGLPAAVALETRSHLDFGDLPNLLAAELGVMTVRLERAIRSLPDVAQVNVNRWADEESHLQVWFLARPIGQLELRGRHLPLWDKVLPPVSEREWRDRLGALAAWLADFGGRAVVDPPRFDWVALDGIRESSGAAHASVRDAPDTAS